MTTRTDFSPQRALRQQLESLQRAGVTHLPKVPAHALPNEQAPTETVSAKRPGRSASAASMPLLDSSGYEGRALPAKERVAALNLLCQEVSHCTLCRELVTNRTQTVFGVGNANARLVFCGEAPGADEDRKGEPFVGAAGQLLTKIIESGLRLKREDVYILNVLKCRPPGNRTPSGEEAASCRPFLERQLEVIRPEIICCLGLVAAQALLGTTQSMGRLRGRFYQYRGSKVLCTYHPAYLLRNPAAKKDVWEDMKLLMREMGMPLPAKQNG
jgi:uracil-DNA glycosylase family 4